MKYRKKPIVIDAIRWDGHNNAEIAAFLGHDLWLNHRADDGGVYAVISVATLEGTLHAREGDWIVKGIKGEFYPVKDDIFRATYEPVKPQAVGYQGGDIEMNLV